MTGFETIIPPALRRSHLQSYARGEDVGRASSHWAMHMGHEATYEDWVPFILARRLQHKLVAQSLSVPTGPEIEPFIQNNRWVAKCECGGAETVDPTEIRYYCLSCTNLLNDHRPRPIAWPEDWRELELIMQARPDPLTRNQATIQNPKTFAWVVMDDAAVLVAENIKHGLPERATV